MNIKFITQHLSPLIHRKELGIYHGHWREAAFLVKPEKTTIRISIFRHLQRHFLNTIPVCAEDLVLQLPLLRFLLLRRALSIGPAKQKRHR